MSRQEDTARALARYLAPPPVEADDDDIDVVSIFRLVRRRMWIIAAVGIATVALALPAILSMVPRYYAETRLIIHDPKTSTLTSAVDAGIAPLNLVTEVERLSSRATSVDVITELGLDSRPELNPALRPVSILDKVKQSIRALIGSSGATTPDETDPLRYVLPEYLSALTVARSPTSGVISIGFRSTDPKLTAAVPNALLRVYLEEKAEQRQLQFAHAEQWFGERIKEQELRIADAQDAVQRFYAERGLSPADLEFDEGATIAVLQASRTELAGRKAAATAKLASYAAADDRAEKLALGDPATVATLERDLRTRQAELDRLTAVYGDRQQDVVVARARVADAEAALDASIDQQMSALRVELDAIERQDTAVVAALAAARTNLSDRATALAERSGIVHSVEWERTALDRLREQQRTLAAESKLPEAEVEVLSPARLPLSADGRGRGFWLVVAMAAAVMLGLTAAVVAEILDRSVRSLQQLKGIAGIVGVGAVPVLPWRAHRRLPAHLRRRPDGLFPDAIRSLARAIEQGSGGRIPDSLLVASALPNEGAPLLATALALELAATGYDVLLVDADPVDGQVHALVGMRDRPGLSDFLCGKAELGAVVRTEPETGLRTIGRGRRLAVGRQEAMRFSEILDYGRANRLVVIVSAVPVLASTGTARLADDVDQVLVAVRWGKTRANAVDTAVQRLRGRGRAVVPVAITMVEPARQRLYGFGDTPIYSRTLRPYFETKA